MNESRTLAGKAARLGSEPCATFGSLWCTAAGTVAPTRNDTLVTHYPVSAIGRTKINDEAELGRAPRSPTPPDRPPTLPRLGYRHNRD